MTRIWWSVAAMAVLAGCGDFVTAPEAASGPAGLRAAAAPAPVSCPANWKTVDLAIAVVECTKRTSTLAGHADVLVYIDYSRGAQLLNLTDPVSAASPQIRSPQFRKHTIWQWWSTQGSSPRRFCVFNGGYFQDDKDTHPTSELSFPVKSNNRLVTAGARTTAPTRRLLSFGGGQAWISEYTLQTNDFTAVSRALPGLSGVMGYGWMAGEDGRDRTYVGVMDRNRDGNVETLAVYLAFRSKAVEVKSFLNSLGVFDVVQLDGGHSTQFYCRKDSYSNLGRLLPHTLGVFTGA